MKKIFFSLTFIAGLIAFQACQSTKTATTAKMLKFNFEKGKGYDYEMAMDVDQTMKGMNNQISMSAYYSMDVTGEEKDTRTIAVTYDRFSMHMNIGGVNIDADSDKPAPSSKDGEMNPLGIIGRLFNAIKGQQFEMKVNAEGKVLEVTGVEAMAKRMIDSMGIEGEMKEKMQQTFNQQFNEKNIREQFEKTFFIFPNKEVKVGDSWEKDASFESTMPMDYNSTYKVKEIEGDMVTLDVKSKIKASREGLELGGTMDGTMVVDSKSGLVVTSSLDQDMKGEASGMPFTMVGKIKVKGKAR